jgi:hypothetical protein
MKGRWIPQHGKLFMLGVIISLGWIVSASGASSPAIVGDWKGTMQTPNGTLRLILHVTQGQGGKLAGTVDSPDQGATGIPITTLSFNEPNLHFEIADISASYDGKLGKDTSDLTGEWKFSGNSVTLNFKRATQ